MESNGDHPGPPEQIDRRRLILGIGRVLLFFDLGVFLPAGTWMWARGWLFILVMFVLSIMVTIYLRRVNPEVIDKGPYAIIRHPGYVSAFIESDTG